MYVGEKGECFTWPKKCTRTGPPTFPVSKVSCSLPEQIFIRAWSTTFCSPLNGSKPSLGFCMTSHPNTGVYLGCSSLQCMTSPSLNLLLILLWEGEIQVLLQHRRLKVLEFQRGFHNSKVDNVSHVKFNPMSQSSTEKSKWSCLAT